MTRKLTRYSSIALALAFTSTLALAETTAADVAQAVDQGQYHKADVLLHDVIQKHPRSARAHFVLAQVLGDEGRPADGLTELNIARSLDPRASYASPARVTKVENQLEADERRQQPVAQEAAPLPPAMTAAPVAMQPVPAPVSRPVDARIWVGIGLAVVLLVLLGVLLSRRARRKREEAETAEMRNQLRSLTALLKTAESAKLDARLNSGDTAAAIASEATELCAHITDALTIVQGGQLLPASDLQALDHRTQIVRARSLGQPTPSLSASADPGYVPRPSSVAYEEPYVRQSTYVPSPVFAGPSTVIVNQPSNDGFLTGVMVGEALSEPRYVERDVIVERDPVVYDAPTYRDDDRDRVRDRDDSGGGNAGAGFDVGNGGSDWDTGGGGGGGGFDVGGGSDDSGGWSDT